MHKVKNRWRYANFCGDGNFEAILQDFLYFINAEHPYTVLYRDGETSFIGNDKVYRKLGSSMVGDLYRFRPFKCMWRCNYKRFRRKR